jgi:hypothetical protein
MKHLFLCLAFALFISSGFAQLMSCEPVVNKIVDRVHNDRINRIVKAPCVINTIANFEKDKNLDCLQPKEKQIQWRCFNGGGCSFLLDITCVSRIDTFDTNNRIVRLSIVGRETDQGVIFESKNNFIQEFEPLQRLP